MLSPVTGSDHVQEVETLATKDIIRLYRNCIGIDVSRFFIGTETISIFLCLDTGYRFYHPQTIFGDAAFYASLQQHPGYYSTWNWEHTQAIKYFTPESTVLEIGCGTGAFLEQIQQSYHVAGLELNAAVVEVAEAKGLAVRNELIEEHALAHSGTYDVVCAFQVFEHISKIKSFLHAALQCLKKDGLLILGVPNNNPYLFKYDKMHALNLPPHHAGLWDKQSLKALENFFPMKNISILPEPMLHYRYFTQILKKHWKETNSWKQWIPYRLLVPAVNIFKHYIEGRNLLAVYRAS